MKKYLNYAAALAVVLASVACNKVEDQKVTTPKKAFNGYVGAHMALKHSPYGGGPCAGTGGWCASLDIHVLDGTPGPIPSDYGRAGFTYDGSQHLLKITFEEYNAEESLEGYDSYIVDADQILPDEVTQPLDMPADAIVLQGIYPLSVDGDGNEYFLVDIQ